ncbi:UNVERIFIED_CONTAM: hypothetical protein K2H54_004470 [Gekko kuhli]
MDRPCAEQFCDQYELEWPKLKELLSKAKEPKSCLQRISEGLRTIMCFKASREPEEDGVLDHMVSIVIPRKTSLLPLNLLRRISVRPGFVIPKVRITKAPPSTFQPDLVEWKSSVIDGNYLQIPEWRYKELREERKKSEEEEKMKAEEAEKQKQGFSQRKDLNGNAQVPKPYEGC